MASHSDWSAALYKGLTGGLSPSVESRSLPTRLAGIERRTGGPKEAAAALGVSPGTYRRWLSGKQKPSAKNANKILVAERRARLKPGREANLRGRKTINTKKGPKGHSLVLTAKTRVSSEKERDRILPVGEYIPATVVGSMIDAWLIGDDRAAIAQLESAIAVYYVQDMEILSIESMDFK